MSTKKFLSFLLVICLVLTIPCHVYAATNVTEESALVANYDFAASIERAKEGFVDSNVSNEILESIVVTGGENISYTVEYLGTVSANSRSADGGNMYAVTATRKVESNDNTEDNVYAWLTLIWIDHLGTENEIVEVNGGWNANGRTLSNRVVMFGYSNALESYIDSERPTSDYFRYTNIGLRGRTLTAHSSVNSGGYTENPIEVWITPTIFD